MGFNCGVGPSHMHRILQILEKPEGKLLTALPNAGYPQMVTGRMLFTGDNKDYFVDRMQQMTALGVDMAGGCCGTTPEYIAELAGKLDLTQYPQAKKDTEPEKQQATEGRPFFYHTKEAEGRNRKLIAVELAPPMGIDDEKPDGCGTSATEERSGCADFPGFSFGTYQSRFHSYGGEGGKRDRYVCHAPYLLPG